MAEFVTFLVALPLLHLIGGFYYRLGVWLCQVLGAGWRMVGASGQADRSNTEKNHHA